MSYLTFIQDLNGIIRPQLQATQTAFDTYIASKTNVQPLLNQRDGVHSNLREKQHRLTELNQLDETYTQSYLNFKENPVKGGFFAQFGLITVQDWSLAFFYFSYVVFSIVILLYTFVKSAQKIYATLIIFTSLLIVCLIFTSFIAYSG
jgi:hypothetical protein